MLATLFTQPIFVLLLEALITVVLALLIGLFIDKIAGMTSVAATTLIANGLLLLLVIVPFGKNLLPLNHLALDVGQFSPDAASHLVNTYLVLEVGLWTSLLAASVGYYLSKAQGAGLLAFFAAAATALCMWVARIPFYPFGLRNTSWMLALAIGVIGIGLAWIFSKFVLESDNPLPLIVLWFEYTLSCWLGYMLAGRAGLLLITLPSQLLLGGGLYVLAGIILPLERGQHGQALRSLITYNLGTNFPYYVIEDWRTRETLGEKKPGARVPGKVSRDYFAGPGIILNNSDHAAVTATKETFEVHPPGLTFTAEHENLYTDVDLRVQNRGAMVKAETKDGIPVTLFAAMPHRVAVGDAPPPALGRSYPFDPNAILTATRQNIIVEHDYKKEGGKAIENTWEIPWYELVLLKGPAILKNIIAQYTCDELHETGPDPEQPRDPRGEIAAEFKKQVEVAVAPLGIELVGAGIGNIEAPQDIVAQRFKNWEARWESRLADEINQAEAENIRQLEKAQSEAKQEVVKELGKVLQHADSGAMRNHALLLELISAMGVDIPQKKMDSNALMELLLNTSGIG
ncbi:MAG TPA: SPFH domain-containing protein [Anaerolineae bacterium]|nr:SPFH domain-containing protein [Anaerolineae bacterium]